MTRMLIKRQPKKKESSLAHALDQFWTNIKKPFH